jgi:hypothetical protein
MGKQTQKHKKSPHSFVIVTKLERDSITSQGKVIAAFHPMSSKKKPFDRLSGFEARQAIMAMMLIQ